MITNSLQKITMFDDIKEDLTVEMAVEIALAGNELDGDLNIESDDVTITGSTVTGDVEVDGDDVTISGLIEGDLTGKKR